MTTKQRVPLAMGLMMAEWLRDRLAPSTERMEIAGSIRRERPDVGDVELLYVPRLSPSGQGSLLGDSHGVVDLLDVALRAMLPVHPSRQAGDSVLVKRLNANGQPIGYGPQNKMLAFRASGFGVDIFRTAAPNWGMALVVRTGPAEWNIAMMEAFRRLGMEGHAYGGVTRDGVEIRCPAEEDVFVLLGIEFIPPQERAGAIGRLREFGRKTL